jgi:hypothetical protein
MRNPDTILPTYHPPQRAHTLPSFDLSPSHNRVAPFIDQPYYYNQTIPTNGSNTAKASGRKKTWFTYIVKYAHVIGLGIAAIGIIVAIVAVVVK